MRGYTVRTRIDLPRKVLEKIPTGGMEMPDAVLLKETGSTRVWEQRLDFGAEVRTIVIKHKKPRRGWKLLRTFMRNVGALREWRMAYAMKIRSLPVVEALAAFERRTLGLVRESFFITEKVEGAQSLFNFVKGNFTGEPSAGQGRRRRRLARSLGRLLRRLHDLGFTQRDMKPANILVRTDDGGEGGIHLVLVDLEGTRLRSKASERRRAWDLARLAVEFVDMPGVQATDLMRVLDEYLVGEGRSPARRRAFQMQIARGMLRKLEQWQSGKS